MVNTLESCLNTLHRVMLDKISHRKICGLFFLGIISFISNFVCYYIFSDNFIFIGDKVIQESSSGKNTFLAIINAAKEKYVAGFSYPNPQICPDLGRKLKVVIMVISDPNHYNIRMNIRRTWGQNKSDVAVVFLMGTTDSEDTRKSLKAERLACGDMVFARFREDYRNLTLKSMSMMQWVSEYCPRAHFLLKADDDMYINVPRLLEVLYKLNVDRRALYGELIRWRIPERQNDSQYFVSLEEYAEKVYPDYLIGPSYLLPASLASTIYNKSLTLPFNSMEDVFITGLVATSLNLKRINTPGFLNDQSFQSNYGACAIFKVITMSKTKFYKYYKDCEGWFQSRF